MKNFRLLLLLSFFVLSLTACKKDDDEDDAPGKMSATINNVAWQADSELYASLNTQNGDNILLLVGKNKNNEEMYIAVGAVSGTGVFTNAADRNKNQGRYSLPQNQNWNTVFGGNLTFTLTKFDTQAKKISGTFTFDAEAFHDNSVKTVSNGTFTDVSYKRF